MTVYLVGAGPGDPELLTLRADAILSRADVVVVDRLVDPRILEKAPPHAEVVHVGKHPRGTGPTCSQDVINEILIERGRRFETVVRLKGGDPFVFGRGGEELAELEEAGIAVEVVPGITSALSLPALAGVALTHRGVSSSVTIASGHEVDAAHWMSFGATDATIVLLMAVENRGSIASLLIDGGRDPRESVLIIEKGTTPNERRIMTSLEALGSVDVSSPAVMVVGDVARFARLT